MPNGSAAAVPSHPEIAMKTMTFATLQRTTLFLVAAALTLCGAKPSRAPGDQPGKASQAEPERKRSPGTGCTGYQGRRPSRLTSTW